MRDQSSPIEQIKLSRFLKFSIDSPYLSITLKIWISGFIFFILFFQLFTIWIYPKTEVFGQGWMLGVALLLVLYFWREEFRTREQFCCLNDSALEMQKKLEDAQIATIASLIKLEEAKDPTARGHSERVTKFAGLLADAQGFSESTKELIRRAAVLHDLGKLGIPDKILQKPEKLDDEEWEIVKRHPQMAVKILEPLKFLTLEKRVILHHHERFDGSGYPKGLKGSQIPFESRIIAVADTFDAMNSEQIYRKAFSREHILEELNHVAGSQLDPALVKLFLGILVKHPELWERST